jgi:hypothetical protein
VAVVVRTGRRIEQACSVDFQRHQSIQRLTIPTQLRSCGIICVIYAIRDSMPAIFPVPSVSTVDGAGKAWELRGGTDLCSTFNNESSGTSPQSPKHADFDRILEEWRLVSDKPQVMRACHAIFLLTNIITFILVWVRLVLHEITLYERNSRLI